MKGRCSTCGEAPATKAAERTLSSASLAPGPPVTSAFLTMAELPEGHSSRRVVELIFASGWGGPSGVPELSVEALFRVHSASRAVARFEEAQAAARAHGAAARCDTDGNEMMRFQCSSARRCCGPSPAPLPRTPRGGRSRLRAPLPPAATAVEAAAATLRHRGRHICPPAPAPVPAAAAFAAAPAAEVRPCVARPSRRSSAAAAAPARLSRLPAGDATSSSCPRSRARHRSPASCPRPRPHALELLLLLAGRDGAHGKGKMVFPRDI
ncbi:hypothetical protein C2845_PM11G18260 [Panicum miliaceum]|uniref:Uncharacterized protein n=1 Tax=Panicum miliaceum TaxID=4540 RepID=A0A3L6RRM7_PANMI|nr:hypothetical protein C2845_PM11G18260 [Panicum miliaceum]